jgi:putative ATP-dependent endonuclease of OLD family
VPATRNVHDQVGALLKGRLWQAARWSAEFRESAEERASELQSEFQAEGPAQLVQEKIENRWRQVHDGDTDSTPTLRLIDRSFGEVMRNADFAFSPNEEGREKPVSELSDGQRSLFHVALTAAVLEIEAAIFEQAPEESDFDHERLRRTCLTILAIEEPENSLSPFFLSRIVRLSREIGGMNTAQVLISSHSPAIVGRIEAEEVRYFRRNSDARRSSIRPILLPEIDAEARSYVRLAVRAYPELYFARFVILGEGESEKLVIPFIAEAMGLDLDPSFVPIVPLGGRYCGHFWRLFSDLEIPYATLLDYDIGREHGGANMIRSIVGNLETIGEDLSDTTQALLGDIDIDGLEALTDDELWVAPDDDHWVHALEEKAVFLSDPLDLDFAMLESFADEYQVANPGGTGPRDGPNAIANAKKATLKRNRDASLYGDNFDDTFRWYSYLFINGSKPDNHLASLGRIDPAEVREKAPKSLVRLVEHVADALNLVEE